MKMVVDSLNWFFKEIGLLGKAIEFGPQKAEVRRKLQTVVNEYSKRIEADLITPKYLSKATKDTFLDRPEIEPLNKVTKYANAKYEDTITIRRLFAKYYLSSLDLCSLDARIDKVEKVLGLKRTDIARILVQ